VTGYTSLTCFSFIYQLKNNSRNSNNRQQILHIGDLESLIILDEIKKIYPAALLSLLVTNNVCNPKKHEELERDKLELEDNLKKKFAGVYRVNLKNTEPIKIYNDYWRQWDGRLFEKYDILA